MRDEPDALSRRALLLPYDCVRRQDPSGLDCPDLCGQSMARTSSLLGKDKKQHAL